MHLIAVTRSTYTIHIAPLYALHTTPGISSCIVSSCLEARPDGPVDTNSTHMHSPSVATLLTARPCQNSVNSAVKCTLVFFDVQLPSLDLYLCILFGMWRISQESTHSSTAVFCAAPSSHGKQPVALLDTHTMLAAHPRCTRSAPAVPHFRKSW